MALSRAFTTRKGSKSQNTAPVPSRSLTTKHSFSAGTIRNKISGPMELLSTTNMISYNAPDLYPISTASPTSSGDESDLPSMSHSTTTTPDSSVRGSGSSSSTPISPSPNHLSSYFDNANNKQPTHSISASTDSTAPSIPQRALSHTKKSHEILSRQRSTRQSSQNSSHSSISTSTRKPSISHPRTSADFFSPAPAFDTTANPFTNELAQVRELAEEYSGGATRRAMMSEEEQDLYSRGLCKFSAEDYVMEIQDLYCEMVGKPVPAQQQSSTMMWI
ncbi:hypothetical protein V499_05416 [Pseudogymnoascus sp. VKM F-103]|uniref:Uncharacterized protein n=1 Tax=Pseudogymnoascus verrucosus TaxID=342668 RepID=A0A1B8GIR8_9PEZI|nr:uncharacterized protein VE01_06498 [Pseudogymnoascus verrucosus]KFY74564.1 hypothetical protein V499_05416 [Pseudogymnoascus sp. VKM F-103]OBT95708.1 hypothetical protein VE01_06498 [Pseudogymnoascus verrucosus]